MLGNGKNGGSGKMIVSECVVDGSSKLSVDACTCTRTCNVALSINVRGSAHCCGCGVNDSYCFLSNYYYY